MQCVGKDATIVTVRGTSLGHGAKYVMSRQLTWSHHTEPGREIYGRSWQPGADEPQLWKCLSEQNDFSWDSAAAERFACDAQP